MKQYTNSLNTNTALYQPVRASKPSKVVAVRWKATMQRRGFTETLKQHFGY